MLPDAVTRKNASLIDQVFESLYGELPPKAGTSLELLFAAALKLANAGLGVRQDQRLIGEESETTYQVDVTVTAAGDTWAGEVKDYTKKGKKVGREDLQKLAGALADIDVKGGLFVSATGYTRPANRYAEAAERIVGKPIDLFHIRPPTDQDLQGRVLSLKIELHIHTPVFERGTFTPEFTAAGHQTMKALVAHKGAGLTYQVREIVDEHGGLMTTVSDLTAKGLASVWSGACGRLVLLARRLSARGGLPRWHQGHQL